MDETVIYMMDDEASIIEFGSIHFEREGFFVVGISDGTSALDKIRSKQSSLVGQGLLLPKLNGCEVWETLRMEENEIPIIMLTPKKG